MIPALAVSFFAGSMCCIQMIRVVCCHVIIRLVFGGNCFYVGEAARRHLSGGGRRQSARNSCAGDVV